MSFSDPSAPFVQPQVFPNGLDGMVFWPQFSNEPSLESNGHFDHAIPPFKRAKNSDDMQLLNNDNNNINNKNNNNHNNSNNNNNNNSNNNNNNNSNYTNYTNNNNNRVPSANPPVNHPAGRIFFKTRLCAKFKMGQCRNGENCSFAHGEVDLRKPPPNWQELVAGRTDDRGNVNGGLDDDDRIIHKMKLCKKFYNGEECPYGGRCNFLHKEPPKFKDNNVNVTTTTFNNDNDNNSVQFRDYSMESAVITAGSIMVRGGNPDQYDVTRMRNGALDASRGNSRPVYWKTRLCNRFEDTGHCGFGDKCHYAHGRAELLAPGGFPTDSDAVTEISIPVQPAPPLSNDPALVKVEADGTSSSQEDAEGKNILKWKLNRKINRIYGDWIDDLPLPNEIEN